MRRIPRTKWDDFCPFACIFMHIHAHRCKTMQVHANPCIFASHSARGLCPCIVGQSLLFERDSKAWPVHAYSCISMHIHAYPCTFMQIHAYSCIFMHIQQCSCTSTHHPCIRFTLLMEFHYSNQKVIFPLFPRKISFRAPGCSSSDPGSRNA